MSRIKSRISAALTLAAIALLVGPVSAGESSPGKMKVQSTCQTCHGMDGQATLAMVPNLSGQRKQYIVIQLQAYRAGRRQHAQMNIIAKMLSDEDIENVADWYSNIKVSVEAPE